MNTVHAKLVPPAPAARHAPTQMESLEPRLCLSASLSQLQVDAAGRHLVTASGRPFFWMADTGWDLFHSLDRAEAITYLDNRAANGFNVLQLVGLTVMGGFNAPNAYGDRPLLNANAATPDVTAGNNPANAGEYDYWDHAEWVIDQAAQRGMYTALLPTWGDHVVYSRLVNASNAEALGLWMGERFKNKPIIWVLGGDQPAGGYENVWRAMAKGIAVGVTGSEDYSRLLMTYHPRHGESSAFWFHNDNWLDFNGMQSGHGLFDSVNATMVDRDYVRTPVKPVIDQEPRYEDIPVNFNPALGYFNDYDTRQAAYWAVFAGAAGHTYGHHSIWQFHDGVSPNETWPIYTWQQALNRPGGTQMKYLRQLIELFPFQTQAPDQALLTNAYSGGDTVRALRGSGHALIYSAKGRDIGVVMDRLQTDSVRASWYNPRNGQSTFIGAYGGSGTRTFTPPSSGRGNDWVLVLEARLRGDVNEDGVIDAQDYAAIHAGYASGLAGYHNGDFNNSGVVDADDFFLIDHTANLQAISWSQGAPEPLAVAGPVPLFATDTEIADDGLFGETANPVA